MSGGYATVGVIAVVAVTAVLSGPLVGAVDLTRDGGYDRSALGQGTADVSDVSLPSEARFSRDAFGAGTVYLDVPPATVDLEDVQGRVHVSYKLSIDGLGLTRGTTHFVDGERDGRYTLAIDRKAVDPSRLTEERYDGSLAVVLYDARGGTTIAERDVTVPVER